MSKHKSKKDTSVDSENLIQVRTASELSLRSVSGTEISDLEVDKLAHAMRTFVEKIQILLKSVPDDVQSFELNEFTLNAEITATARPDPEG